jgi:fermentation-respiration switch protein FrsA (DUF1100 family)
MFIVGQKDGVVPPVDLQRILDDARHPVRFREINGANHNFLGQAEEVAEQVICFLLKTLES